MNERDYEVCECVIRGEPRWRVVDKATRKVLDDADGWGYKSARNAHAGWSFKRRTDSEKREWYNRKVAVWKFLLDNKNLVRHLETEAWYALKDGEDFGVADVEAAIKHLGIETEFSPNEIYRVWTDGPPRDPVTRKKWHPEPKANPKPKSDPRKEERKRRKAAEKAAADEWVAAHGEFRERVLEARAAAKAANERYDGNNVRELLAELGITAPARGRLLLKAVLRQAKGGADA